MNQQAGETQFEDVSDVQTELSDEECLSALCGYDDNHLHGPECTTDCPCGTGEVAL
ncbi:hypothetical protein Xcel_3408 (plasmid) [Xylanimonas cellulosilytica DSM 15894]|uniref:Uncharacterized protein n=1 Tax=Xylanimonas cellulosilytica (strain DSM 15894 / JCM 12276 / CECT 5975 / KCTC 9989 / LMG 20990 / NBRC 107835 / XIL07) TaxID=446471 RepID=D1C0U1_XYLCX|nr:hypothetical protein [Xylanimonas cellulosilytica]ACZ32407.1 hypothetical protein Xcel_3408 [Xylanimonas cellulosilytica DSM 15894]